MERSIVFIIGCLLLALAGCAGCREPCDNVICENGANCMEGDCMCLPGWEGSRCDMEITPSKIFIKSVKVTRMPEKDGVNTWDITAGQQNPDLMLILWRDGNYPTMAWVPGLSSASFGGTQMNRDPLTTHIFTYQGTGEGSLNFPQRKYLLSLYDDDGEIGTLDGDDDLIGEIIFTPYQNGQQFPKTIILSNSAVTFEITVEYKW